MNKRKILFLVILTLIIPLTGSKTLTDSVNGKENDFAPTSSQNFNAITTQTFTGTINVTAFVGPDAAYDLVLSSIRRASTSFYLEVYTLSSEPLVNALINAHGRGVGRQRARARAW